MEKTNILDAVKIINDTVKNFDGTRSYLSTGDLDITEIKSLEEVTYIEKPSRANQNIKNGDIILARMQGTVKVKIITLDEEDIIVSTGFMVLRCKKNADNRYVFHYLKSSLFQSKKDKLCSGATQKAINNNKFAEIQIPLPELSTQQKIATILDKADELCQYNQQLIEKYDALTQSLFLDMFGDPVKNEKEWEKVELMEICAKITDGTHKTPTYLDSGVIFLSAKNIKNFKLNCLSPKYISSEEHFELKRRCNVEVGDILITKSGSLGMAALVDFDFEFSIFESLALIKYLRENVNGIFLLHFLNTESTQQQYNDITKGVGVKHLHLTDLRKLKIILPPIELQNQFGERIQLIGAQKEQAQEALVKSEVLFQGLLQQAFKGELN